MAWDRKIDTIAPNWVFTTAQKTHGYIKQIIIVENIQEVKLTRRIMARLVGCAYDPLGTWITLFTCKLKWAFSSAIQKVGTNIGELDHS